MFKFLSALAILSAAICGAVAKPALPVPATGKYRIQNADTGFFLDDSGGSQNLGNPVFVQTLNQPLTSNQEWNVSIFSGSAIGQIQSISSFIVANNQSGATLLSVNPSQATSLLFVPVPGGVAICLNPQTNSCFTSPVTALTQVPVLPFTKALNQTWIFEPVGGA
ncbi:hypothetical protein PHLGIDRAFT_167729 [Phlebiopsis gigantea 11061_1 CR5-6]|uniref:Ricin B lectin domain-containing protein n=1 Tax=Phlebiopsis gigantea (strain 11061_1 CR5-6) TaxID=745531 RepID=A0A0C3S862_PHLG1|nr:hypothetical protein PHLGIDRAFT_167729 [Phlebiopsis gigantea 11061_1 CR5-6]